MKKLLLAGTALAFFGAPLFSTTKYSTNPDECVDGVCFVPQYADDGRENYAIVSPVGYHDVPMIKQAKKRMRQTKSKSSRLPVKSQNSRKGL